MENTFTKELIDYYKKVAEYLKQLDSKKAEVEKNLDVSEPDEVSDELEESVDSEEGAEDA